MDVAKCIRRGQRVGGILTLLPLFFPKTAVNSAKMSKEVVRKGT